MNRFSLCTSESLMNATYFVFMPNSIHYHNHHHVAPAVLCWTFSAAFKKKIPIKIPTICCETCSRCIPTHGSSQSISRAFYRFCWFYFLRKFSNLSLCEKKSLIKCTFHFLIINMRGGSNLGNSLMSMLRYEWKQYEYY